MYERMLKKVVASFILSSLFACYMFPSMAFVNEETIYSNLKPNGETYKVVAGTIKENNDGTKAEKNEIQKELPIECSVIYKLDGIEMPANEIVGKKGKVTIELKYVNKDEKNEWINGQNEKVYTPFLVISGMILDNKNNKNIEVNNGKIINNGEKTIVAGFAVPGLIESLKIENSKFNISDTIEISLETECFELSNIMTYATPKAFESLSIKLEDFNELFDKVNQLQSASGQIEDGAISLNNGIVILNEGVTTLKNGSVSFDNGVSALKQGASSLNYGAIALKDGIDEYAIQSEIYNQGVAKISDGASMLNENYGTLDAGISGLSDGSLSLKDGAEQLSTGTSLLAQGAESLSENVDNIAGSISELKSGAVQVSCGLDQIVSNVGTQKEDLENAEVPQTIIDNLTLIAELKRTNTTLQSELENVDDSLKEVLNSQIAINNESIEKLTASNSYIQSIGNQSKESITSLYNGLTSVQSGASEVVNGISLLDDGMGELSKGTASIASNSKDIANGAAGVSAGANQVSAGATSLASGSKQVVQGLNSLSNGAATLSDAGGKLNDATAKISSGAEQLQNGTSSLYNGANELEGGTKVLVNGINSLSDGSKKLVDGSGELVDGIKKFNMDGIDKICNLVNNDGKSLIKRIEKLEELSKNYDTFASDEKRDNIQFISIMDNISKADIEKKK